MFSRDSSDPVNHFEPGELVVLNPPGGFSDVVSGLGYRIIESTTLDGLGVTAFRLKVPPGKSVPESKRELANRFPGASVDANHRFASQARKVMHARGAMGWRAAAASCGRRVKIGQIDSGVDLSHAALKGQRIKFRSFHSKGTKPGPRIHGTAVAAMLIGKPNGAGCCRALSCMLRACFRLVGMARKLAPLWVC